MSYDIPSCAHMHIEHHDIFGGDGSHRAEWRCRDCDMRFQPVLAAPSPLAGTAMNPIYCATCGLVVTPGVFHACPGPTTYGSGVLSR